MEILKCFKSMGNIFHRKINNLQLVILRNLKHLADANRFGVFFAQRYQIFCKAFPLICEFFSLKGMIIILIGFL